MKCVHDVGVIEAQPATNLKILVWQADFASSDTVMLILWAISINITSKMTKLSVMTSDENLSFLTISGVIAQSLRLEWNFLEYQQSRISKGII